MRIGETKCRSFWLEFSFIGPAFAALDQCVIVVRQRRVFFSDFLARCSCGLCPPGSDVLARYRHKFVLHGGYPATADSRHISKRGSQLEIGYSVFTTSQRSKKQAAVGAQLFCSLSFDGKWSRFRAPLDQAVCQDDVARWYPALLSFFFLDLVCRRVEVRAAPKAERSKVTLYAIFSCWTSRVTRLML